MKIDILDSLVVNAVTWKVKGPGSVPDWDKIIN
jgi:hypothetical protein